MADITPIQPGRGRKTYRDRLRAMTDEELAEWLDGIQTRAYDFGARLEGELDDPLSKEDWLELLKQEVSDNG